MWYSMYPFDPKAVLDHDTCVQMVTLQTSGVDSTTASTLVQRDAENSDVIAEVAAAFTKEEETLFARWLVEVMIWHVISAVTPVKLSWKKW